MNPLSQATINNIRAAYAKLSRLDDATAKAEACGIDCQTLTDRRRKAMEDLRKLNEVYGAEYPDRQNY